MWWSSYSMLVASHAIQLTTTSQVYVTNAGQSIELHCQIAYMRPTKMKPSPTPLPTVTNANVYKRSTRFQQLVRLSSVQKHRHSSLSSSTSSSATTALPSSSSSSSSSSSLSFGHFHEPVSIFSFSSEDSISRPIRNINFDVQLNSSSSSFSSSSSPSSQITITSSSSLPSSSSSFSSSTFEMNHHIFSNMKMFFLKQQGPETTQVNDADDLLDPFHKEQDRLHVTWMHSSHDNKLTMMLKISSRCHRFTLEIMLMLVLLSVCLFGLKKAS
ncbi:hypothetical protein HELRODRAFT_169474 [Helobdella robusta]|uniref:Ig-like domain-containing protein n=1 Tax=Helobdella robusta TaxID=6412 RepID=T1F1Z6_HELRO|nr:hypothetical protein HELRODRAFT_169474 [Helobdella robusta]ESO08598.1 hypothetical protein HELRODRAFT_169474 [Helobdella robusta]